MRLGLICRVKDEYFIEEFVNYYISQGVDTLYIIDDNSKDRSVYDNLLSNDKVVIIFEKNIIKNAFANTLYKKIRNEFEWMIHVDADEFITTRKNVKRTIRQELESTFKNSHCVKVPWVMMGCNSLIKSPASILETNIYRWNHDLKHPNNSTRLNKFRCRYDEIGLKSIFKSRFFKDLSHHHPLDAIYDKNETKSTFKPNLFGNSPKETIDNKSLNIADSIENKPAILDSFYHNLREKHIATGYLLCYHYRIISLDNCKNKLATNKMYIDNRFNIQDLMSTDYSEVIDTTMQKKSRLIKAC